MDSGKLPWNSWMIWICLAVAILPQIEAQFTALQLPEPWGRAILFVLGVAGIVARTMSSGAPIVLPTIKKE